MSMYQKIISDAQDPVFGVHMTISGGLWEPSGAGAGGCVGAYAPVRG